MALALAGSAAAQDVVTLSVGRTDRVFDGIGAVNGGGATAVLLKDYPRHQRDEILDMVFRPEFGASVSTMLVEVPGDGNSTQGSMPSHAHWRGDENFHRGYIWWVIEEAKRRNPLLTLDATAWSAPGWVGQKNWWSQDMADYYVQWMRGLRDVYGLRLDAIGCHNEKGTDYDFAKRLRRTMDEAGFADVRLHAFDNWGQGKMNFLDDMVHDPELRDAIDIVSAHTFTEIPLTASQWHLADSLGKPIWNTEDHIYLKGFDCLIKIVKSFNENYIESGATKVVNWYDIGAVYPMEPYSTDPPMILAHEPWSGHYTVKQNLWGYAHYGQFSQAGWRYVDDGCRRLSEGGSMVTLRNPDTGDWSVIVETDAAETVQTLSISLGEGLKTSSLCQWRSNEAEQFMKQPKVRCHDGIYTLLLEPHSVYSFSTTRGQRKGEFRHIPESRPFPMPYSDDFEGYTNLEKCGYLPRYTADIIGAFELTPRPDGRGQCLRQVVSQSTNSWAPEWHHYTILGDRDWTDCEVRADILLGQGDEAGVMGRVCDVGTGYGVWAKGYYLKLSDTGLLSLVVTKGKPGNKQELIGDAEQQALIKARNDREAGGETVLAESHLDDVSTGEWHTLTLRMQGSQLTGLVDGTEVLRVSDSTYSQGMAGFIAPLHGNKVSTPWFDNLMIQ